ncbi:hypothetical protein SDC9_169394 [bioreactor metagenome]|uniref:Uncharacterized protein n=1 Tax=bioreactor metagenome TaxID=1076179 RepID=A0A645G568_9ZZZZ
MVYLLSLPAQYAKEGIVFVFREGKDHKNNQVHFRQ